MGEKFRKVKYWAEDNKEKIFYASLAAVLGIFGFLLGKISEIEHKKAEIIIEQAIRADYGKSAYSGVPQPIGIENNVLGSSAQVQNSEGTVSGKYVASKKGTAYHLPTCPGAKQIKEENKIYFETKEEAVSAGYKPAGNCPQLSAD